MSAGRVAVVVVAGVGDTPRTDAAERVTNGLTKWAHFTAPTEHSEWFAVPEHDPKEPALQPVQRFNMTSPGGTETDVYEFWWADLSRFPAAMRSFIAAFVGLFLAFPAIGRTALRDSSRVTYQAQDNPGGRWNSLDFRLLGVVAWLTAVPVVVFSAMTLVVVGGLAIAITLPDTNIGAAALALYGVVLSFVGLVLLRHYEQKSGRSPSFLLGCIALAGAVAVCTWRLVERGVGGNSVDLALADTVTVFVTYPMRVLWLTVVVAIVLAVLVLGVKLAFSGPERAIRRRQTVSALVTLGFGPIGLASLMAILSAAIGASVQKLSESVKWDPHQPICLTSPDAWYWTTCPAKTRAWDFGVLNLEDSIFSLVCASAVTTAVLLLVVVIAGYKFLPIPFVGRAKSKPERQAAGTTHALRVVDNPWTCRLMVLAGFAAAYGASAAWLRFFVFWGSIRHDAVRTPVVAAILGGSVTTLILAGRVMGLTPKSLASDGAAPGALRAILDKPYDIATFLREPSGFKLGRIRFGILLAGDRRIPRQAMLDRFRALMRHLESKGYDRIVFVAHSQGTILTTTLLAEGEDDFSLPGKVSLMTFGCPLRQLYLQRFPHQWAWVNELEPVGTRRNFVRRVNETWVNLAMSGDPIGRTVFRDPPAAWPGPGPAAPLPSGTPELEEILLGPGGHTAYWKSEPVYIRLRGLVEAP